MAARSFFGPLVLGLVLLVDLLAWLVAHALQLLRHVSFIGELALCCVQQVIGVRP